MVALTPASLGIVLSRLAVFDTPLMKLEQYPTPSQLAANFLMKQQWSSKTVLDLGCGTGLLGIGALLLGAKKVLFVDVDEKALGICQKNYDGLVAQGYELGQAIYINKDIQELEDHQADMAVMNPPFGTKQRHIDKEFLSYARRNVEVIMSMHKTSTIDHLIADMKKHEYLLVYQKDVMFPIKATMAPHVKPKKDIEVSLVIWNRV